MSVKIVEVLELGRKKAKVLVEGSPFHPSGGGQPGDTGTLRGPAFRAGVEDARRHNARERGEEFPSSLSVLDLALISGEPEAGMELEAEVDEVRNRLLSRMHTGQHLFSRFQENAHEGLRTLKVNIGIEESAVYIHYDGELTWDALFSAEERTNEVIRADLPVETLLTTRDGAERIPELKAKWERIHDEEIRVVRIEGVDATACAGTHAARTGEIGTFMVTGFNGSAPEWEVRFTVHAEAEKRLKNYGHAMRRLLREVGCRADEMSEVFARAKTESAALRAALDKARAYISIPWEEKSVEGCPLYLAVLPGLPKELLSAPARTCVAEHPDAFCLVLLPAAENPSAPFPFLLLRGASLSVDLSSFIRKFPELSARGGGKPDWLNGTTTQRTVSVWLDALRAASVATA
ncbi:MAG: alanyl-tRNA editing protein [Synergistaceae bacterium]|jgi:alanyl-tRNA synthetase|nr:alanyl-tRNA editing protein [Synergistaceae bacterium]